MTIATLRAAIKARAAELLPEALVLAEKRHHKNHLWLTCSCTYCATKRQATFEIGTPPVGYGHNWRGGYRDKARIAFREKLAIEAERID